MVARSVGELFSITILHLFQCSVANNGCNPQAGLIQLADGFLYGTTVNGRSSNQGTVFKILPDGTDFSVIKSFECSIAANGCNPQARLNQLAGGFLYGTTFNGGASNAGTLVKMIPDGSNFSVIKSFPCGADACAPRAGLIQGADEFLYGTTNLGGANSQGTVFKILPNGAGFQVMAAFNCAVTANGCNPQAGLIQLADGFL
jgi:uncharacterized repeat protein (TIGR03803 family)